MCSVCGEVKDASLFPFESRSECYLCYERVTGRTLHSFRQGIGRQKAAQATTSYYQSNKAQTAPNRSTSAQEVSREYIMQYLKTKTVMRQPINIYYKDDKTLRTFYNFRFDDVYLRVPSTHGYDYKYLINQIRNVQ